MESPLPIVDQEIFFAGTCLLNCLLATDIHVTISSKFIRTYVIREVEIIFLINLIILHLVLIVMCHISAYFERRQIQEVLRELERNNGTWNKHSHIIVYVTYCLMLTTIANSVQLK